MVNLETIKNLIKKNQTTVYISYIDMDGFPVTKALLAPRKMDSLRKIYFSTNTSSNKVKAFKKNPKGSIYFVDKRFYRGVSLIGTVEVIDEAQIKQALWQAGDERFYPKGVSDPDYCVLKFSITHGRYFASKNQDFTLDVLEDIDDENIPHISW